MMQKDQYWVQWHTAIMFGVLLVVELLFLPETLYPRSLMLKRQSMVERPEGEKSEIVCDPDISRTINLPFLNLRPVPGVGVQKPYDALFYFLKTWTYPNIAISIFFYSFAMYWWILSIITYLPVAYAQYRPEIQGLLFIGLILGTLAAELLCSGHLSDIIVLRLAKRNNNIRLAEMRLWLIYPSIIITSFGLILWGISIDRGHHWIVGQIAFFFFAAGIQMGNTVWSAYVVDCYPEHAMSVITFYAVLLNGSAFVNPFFIAPWVDKIGFSWTFGGQAIITAAVMGPVTVGLQRYGGRLREWRGPPTWVSPEYST